MSSRFSSVRPRPSATYSTSLPFGSIVFRSTPRESRFHSVIFLLEESVRSISVRLVWRLMTS
ncbi:MAG: hypothetical protein HMLKMBBP_02694 [Planctomycetes bacterium]|nr:hypothetical protein [Planctomycetota bacterium]